MTTDGIALSRRFHSPPSRSAARTPFRLALAFLPLPAIAACARSSDALIVYCSVDERFARQILDAFQSATGLTAEPVFDSEAGKTTGLINRIRAERERPRADVLFSGELFNTMRLANEGLLEPFDPPAAADIPRRCRDPARRWTAIGARGRVLAFDPKRIARDQLPDTWEQLAAPRYASRLAFANPLFGTTKGHIAAMFVLWGDDRAVDFLKRLRDNGALMVDGNSSAVRAVIDGRADWCMTDTDDVWVARRDGAALDLKHLDMGDGGTLWIPCSVALIKNARHPDRAKRLVDFLVSADTERMLARSESRNVPVRSALRRELGIAEPPASKVSFTRIAARLESSTARVREILLR